jgi:hypothetical protein
MSKLLTLENGFDANVCSIPKDIAGVSVGFDSVVDNLDNVARELSLGSTTDAGMLALYKPLRHIVNKRRFIIK